jgi:hypothetical protein
VTLFEAATDLTLGTETRRRAVEFFNRLRLAADPPSPASPREPQAVVACLDCGLPYSEFPLDVVLPRSQWLDIHPAEHGVLCAACIVKRAAKMPGATCVHAIIEIAPRPSHA